MNLKKSMIIGASILTLVPVASAIFISDSALADEVVVSQVQETNQGSAIEIPKLSEGESFSQEIVMADGQTGIMEVTLVEEYQEDETDSITLYAIPWHTRKDVTNGVYNVNVVAGVYNAGFKINVKNKNIVSAYDPWMFNLVGSTGNLVLDNSKQATYEMDFNASIPWINGPAWTGGVRAKIEGSNLVTYTW